MINLFVHIIKMEKQNISAQVITNHLCRTFTASDRNRCSSCGRTGMKYVRKYTRSLTEWHNNHPVDVQIETSLYQCECGHYHVLLPSVVIPYCLYSLPFIVMVLWEYFNHVRTIEEICRRYHISVPTLYRWIELFKRDKEIWLKDLADLETSAAQFLNHLRTAMTAEEHRSFMEGVYPHRMFMQSHKTAYLHRYV